MGEDSITSTSELEWAELVGPHDTATKRHVAQNEENEDIILVPHSCASRLRSFSMAFHDALLVASLGVLLLGMAGTTMWWSLERFGPWAWGVLSLCRHIKSLVAYVCKCRIGNLLAVLLSITAGYLTLQPLRFGQAALQYAGHWRQKSFILQQVCLFCETFASRREQQLQAVAIFASLQLTALPVLDIYSAVALFAPPRHAGRCSCWEALHGPAFYLFGARYIAASMPTVLRAEHDTDGGWWMSVLQDLANFCESASSVVQIGLNSMAATYALVIIAWNLGTVQAEHFCKPFGWDSVSCTVGDGPLAGRGLVLGLHALGAACGVGARLLIACKRDDFLRIVLRAFKRWGPMLLRWLLNRVPPLQRSAVIKKFSDEISFVADSGRTRRRMGRWADTVVSFNRWWPTMLEAVPVMREAAPPVGVVKFLVAVQTFSPLLALTAALISQADVWPRQAVAASTFLSGMILTYCLSNLGPAVPERKLERLVLLLPRFYVDPSTRTTLGYVLQTTKRARRLMWVPLTLFEVPRKLLGW